MSGAYYFGCVGGPGHGLHAAGATMWRELSGDRWPADLPWTAKEIDSNTRFLPTNTRRQGAARLTVANGWTVLAVHDNSVDDRGSHSTFLLRGEHSFVTAIARAGRFFPEILTRIGGITDAGAAESFPANEAGK